MTLHYLGSTIGARTARDVCSALAPKIYDNLKAFRVCVRARRFRNSTRDRFRFSFVLELGKKALFLHFSEQASE
jgi:hypothetical protein